MYATTKEKLKFDEVLRSISVALNSTSRKAAQMQADKENVAFPQGVYCA